ncbi:HEAT repeat domain-containing protein [bacterium]|nr:MAG: HEAT repeat domain-containing protein [bacterium]
MQKIKAVAHLLIFFSLSLPAHASPTGRFETLAARLQDPNLSTRQRLQAAKELGQLGDPRGIDPLLQALNLPGEEMPEIVVPALRQLKAAELLSKRAVDEKLPISERLTAVKGLRYLQDPIGFTALAKALGSTDAMLRAAAAWALSVAGAPQAEQELIRALNDPDKDVRYFAADALGSVKTPAVRAALEARQKIEQDFTVKYALQQALSKFSEL